MKLNGTYYLNNRGDRWVVFQDGKKPTATIQLPNGKYEKRTILWYESFGNFGVACISYKGVKRTYLMDVLDNGEIGIIIQPERHKK
jgi:hypothetical protein